MNCLIICLLDVCLYRIYFKFDPCWFLDPTSPGFTRQVFEWLDLKRNEVDAMLGQVDPHLRGAVQPKVWFYISGHSQMALGCPRFLPADAGSWGDGVSIFKMVRRLSNVTGCREARIHVMLNGCMAFPTGLEKLAWWCKYGFSMQDWADWAETLRVLPGKTSHLASPGPGWWLETLKSMSFAAT